MQNFLEVIKNVFPWLGMVALVICPFLLPRTSLAKRYIPNFQSRRSMASLVGTYYAVLLIAISISFSDYQSALLLIMIMTIAVGFAMLVTYWYGKMK